MSKKYKPRWHESPFDHVHYCLVRNQSQMDRALRDLPSHPFKDNQTTAEVLTLDVLGDRKYCLLQIGATTDWLPSFIMQVLVHESLHIWQTVKDAMHESNPCREFEAYSVEQIFRNMLDDYDRSQT